MTFTDLNTVDTCACMKLSLSLLYIYMYCVLVLKLPLCAGVRWSGGFLGELPMVVPAHLNAVQLSIHLSKSPAYLLVSKMY